MEKIREIKSGSGKIIAVDFGDVRTGLAVSDPARILAFGIGFINPGGIERTADETARILLEQEQPPLWWDFRKTWMEARARGRSDAAGLQSLRNACRRFPWNFTTSG